ncbi:MAG TPA: hypothetical protein VIE43_26285 [Thermoanaerobaculia bacterium]|jgi:hypothetical protein|nr:hypothetical protein [Thermoanaerobaculia bacterium]
MNAMRQKALLLIALGLLASAVAHAQCNIKDYLYADFKTGLVVNTDPTDFIVLSPMTASSIDACKGWLEMAVQINIPKGCTGAIIDTDYEGTPYSWTLNIGDSPTNDGFAGDAGTTVHNAELWILNEDFWLANAGGAPSLIDNPLIFNHVSLRDGALKFLVKDQFLSWGQPYQSIQSPTNHLLFAIPDPTVTPADQNSIYAGFNRVIYGAPWNGREGCGLRTAVVRFQ